MKQYAAVRALRLNYRWRGVWVWLKARHYLRSTTGGYWYRVHPDIRHMAHRSVRGWWLVLHMPEFVADDQHALAEGVTS